MNFYTLIALVILPPLALGAVYPWTIFLVAVISGGMLLLSGQQWATRQARPAVSLSQIIWIAVPFMAAVLWAFLQTRSWMPESWAHPIWQRAGAILPHEPGHTISTNPEASMVGVIRLLTYGAIFWLTLQHCRNAANARRAMVLLVVAGLGYAAYGLVVEFTGMDKVLWFDKKHYVGSLTGTFINRNSFAAYLGLILICCIALSRSRIKKTMLKNAGHDADRISAAFLVDVIPEIIRRDWFWIIAPVILFAALMLTESRGGIATTIFGIAVLALALGRTSKRGQGYLLSAVLTGLGILAITAFVLSGGEILSRFSGMEGMGEGDNQRMFLYRLTLDMIAEQPLVGTGLGTFAEIFPIFRANPYYYNIMAHNTYLETALELGIPAFLCLLAAIAVAGRMCWRACRTRQQSQTYPAVGIAVLAQLSAHSLIDFSLQIPAVALTFTFLLAIGCAQSWSSRQSTG